MKWDDLKYLIAYIGPTSAYLSVLESGLWTYSAIIVTFIIIPVLELMLPGTDRNLSEIRFSERKSMWFFDLLLYLHLPLLYGLIASYLWRITFTDISNYEWMGMTLGVGIFVGSSGINIAHELGHRSSGMEQLFSKWLLLPALYQHFFIEHNRGHHKNVATQEDPATSLYGEWIFTFWIRSVVGSYQHAWKLEWDRLSKKQVSFYSFANQMIRFTIYQSTYLIVIYFFFGAFATVNAILIAIIGFLLLESINYIEHYGLLRKKTETGYYERVGMQHSWNSNHEIGRIFLYELTRHADHHYKASKKYQTLEHYAESPQLPMGYPGAILLALIPPLWFRIMNDRVPKKMLVNAHNEK